MQSGDKQVFQIQKSFGLELGRFRLKEGMSEAALQEAYQAMVTNLLSKQSGWRGQHLVKLGDGIFLDVAFALTEDHAKAICAVGAISPFVMLFWHSLSQSAWNSEQFSKRHP